MKNDKIRSVLQVWEKSHGTPPLGVILSQVNSHVDVYLNVVKSFVRSTSEKHPDGPELVQALQVVTRVAFQLQDEEPKVKIQKC